MVIRYDARQDYVVCVLANTNINDRIIAIVLGMYTKAQTQVFWDTNEFERRYLNKINNQYRVYWAEKPMNRKCARKCDVIV